MVMLSINHTHACTKPLVCVCVCIRACVCMSLHSGGIGGVLFPYTWSTIFDSSDGCESVKLLMCDQHYCYLTILAPSTACEDL